MAATSDIFLGWVTRRRPRRGVPRLLRAPAPGLEGLRGRREPWRPPPWPITAACAAGRLARAHARSGDRIAIAAYLGGSDSFDQALAEFSEAYADQNERDYDALVQAEKDGRITAQRGL